VCSSDLVQYELATSSNWASIRNSHLTNYPASLKLQLDAYIAVGFHLLLPKYGSLDIGAFEGIRNGIGFTQSFPNSDVTAFFAFMPDFSESGAVLFHTTTGALLKGGVGVTTETIDGYALEPPTPPEAFDSAQAISSVDVDGRSGELSLTPPPDLVDGSGSFPYSLSFQRQYSSNSQEEIGIGAGWTHNWNHNIQLSNDGSALFGGQGAFGAASAIVTVLALADLSTDSANARSITASIYAADWLVKQGFGNVAVMTSGLSGSQNFARRATGDFLAPGRSTATLEQTGSIDTSSYINRPLYNDVTFEHVNAVGDVSQFTQINAGDYGTEYHLTLSARPEFHMTSWALHQGVTITLEWSYDNEGGFASLGRVRNDLGAYLEQFEYEPGAPVGLPSCNGDLIEFGDAIAPFRSFRNSGSDWVRFHQTLNHLLYYPANVFGATGPYPVRDPNDFNDIHGLCDDYLFTGFTFQRKDWRGALLSTEHSDGSVWSYEYDHVPGILLAGVAPTPVRVRGLRGVLTEIFAPGDSENPALTFAYGEEAGLQTVTDINGAIYQHFPSARGYETINPVGSRSQSFDDAYGQTALTVDAVGRRSRTFYDDLGRTVRIENPEGDAVEYVYGPRDTVVTERQLAKPGSGLTPLESSYSYATSCTASNLAWCNKPLTVTDPRANVTTFTYATSGQNGYGRVTSITAPPLNPRDAQEADLRTAQIGRASCRERV